jgi:hypothetical protein
VDRNLLEGEIVRGFITERDFASAECEFPGIRAFYLGLAEKPLTFLELVWRFVHQGRCGCASTSMTSGSSPTSAHRQDR